MLLFRECCCRAGVPLKYKIFKDFSVSFCQTTLSCITNTPDIRNTYVLKYSSAIVAYFAYILSRNVGLGEFTQETGV